MLGVFLNLQRIKYSRSEENSLTHSAIWLCCVLHEDNIKLPSDEVWKFILSLPIKNEIVSYLKCDKYPSFLKVHKKLKEINSSYGENEKNY